MPIESWKIDDIASDAADNSERLASEMGPASFEPLMGDEKIGSRVFTLCRGKSAGLRGLRLVCGQTELDLCLTRGLGIARMSRGGIRFGWDSPVGNPTHPMWVNVGEPSGIGWLDGFTETVVRCGLASNGAPQHDEHGKLEFPLHGRIANLPAENVSVELDRSAGSISVTADVFETRFLIQNLRLRSRITLRLDSNTVEIADSVTNLLATPAEFQMLYHNNFGSPILEKGAQFSAPIKRLVPRNEHAATGIDDFDQYSGPTAGFEEQVYFMQLQGDDTGQTTAMVNNAAGTSGVAIGFDVNQLPYFSLWKNTAAESDGYVTGLEPATNFPNPRGFEGQHGRAISLAPGQTYPMNLRIGLLTSAAEVSDSKRRVDDLKLAEATISEMPQRDWCS